MRRPSFFLLTRSYGFRNLGNVIATEVELNELREAGDGRGKVLNVVVLKAEATQRIAIEQLSGQLPNLVSV